MASNSKITTQRACLFLMAMVCACTKSEPKHEAEGNAAASATTLVPSAPTQAALSAVEPPAKAPFRHPQSAQELLATWTQALNERDFEVLQQLYAPEVWFYGTHIKREEVLQRKRNALERTQTFHQQLLGEPTVQEVETETIVRFRKRSGPKGSENDVLATLSLASEGPLLIRRESDEASERTFGLGYVEEREPVDCSDATWMMVDSTRQARRIYAEIEQNLKGFPPDANLNPGGMGPFAPTETQTDTYDLAIGVHHPQRFESYAWFTITRAGKVQVSSMYGMFEESATPSKKALAHFERLCGE